MGICQEPETSLDLEQTRSRLLLRPLLTVTLWICAPALGEHLWTSTEALPRHRTESQPWFTPGTLLGRAGAALGVGVSSCKQALLQTLNNKEKCCEMC